MIRLSFETLNLTVLVKTCFQISTKDGTWVQLDKDTISNCCFNLEEEAWSLATDKNQFIYLRPEVSDGGNKPY